LITEEKYKELKRQNVSLFHFSWGENGMYVAYDPNQKKNIESSTVIKVAMFIALVKMNRTSFHFSKRTIQDLTLAPSYSFVALTPLAPAGAKWHIFWDKKRASLRRSST
jgi:hypothetical protein